MVSTILKMTDTKYYMYSDIKIKFCDKNFHFKIYVPSMA